MQELRDGARDCDASCMDACDWLSVAALGGAMQSVGEVSMTEKVLTALNAITARVLSYRPKDKGLAAKKTERRLKRAAKKEAHDDRESSI